MAESEEQTCRGAEGGCRFIKHFVDLTVSWKNKRVKGGDGSQARSRFARILSHSVPKVKVKPVLLV